MFRCKVFMVGGLFLGSEAPKLEGVLTGMPGRPRGTGCLGVLLISQQPLYFYVVAAACHQPVIPCSMLGGLRDLAFFCGGCSQFSKQRKL